MCAKELETNANFMEPEIPTKNTKTKKLKPKKRARPKLTVDTPESYVGKADDESPLGSAAASGETPPSTKSKKTKGKKKNKNSTAATPSKAKFEFRDATSQDDSFSENSSVSPNEIAKEVVAMAAKQMEAQRNSRQIPSDNDDDVFTTNHDGRDGLSLLAQASFETADKSTKRKRSSENSALSEDLSQKKRGRPKKDMESPLSEPGKLLPDSLMLCGWYRAFSYDVSAAILVFQNKETVAMLAYQTNPLGIELYLFANMFCCFSKPIWPLVTCVKTLYKNYWQISLICIIILRYHLLEGDKQLKLRRFCAGFT